MKMTVSLVRLVVILNILLLAPAVAQSIKPVGSKSTVSPDIDPKALWDGRKAVEFHSLQFPRMVRAADARFLIDNEYVLGITEHGESRAYPTRFLSWHHIINDRIGNKESGKSAFVTITYCIVCNSGMRFDTPMVNNRPLVFDFYGLYNGVMTMYDTSTKTVWLQVGGRAVKGPLMGATLKSGPVLDTTWGQWKKLHPDTLVMAPDPVSTDDYEPKGSIMVRGYSEFPAAYFGKTVTHRDSRLPMFEPILAVSLPASKNPSSAGLAHARYRAYPLKTFRSRTGVLNDMIGEEPVAVFFLANSETLTAISRVLNGQALTLECHKSPRGALAFYDKETGTRWNIEGKGEEGPLAGKQLPRIDSHMSQWYGWVSYFPQTTIYGQDSTLAQGSVTTSNR